MPQYKVDIISPDCDPQELLSLVKEAITNSPFSSLSTEEEFLKQTVDSYCNSNLRTEVAFILFADDTPVGFLAAVAGGGHPMMRGKIIATEIVWYVSPEHRGNPESMGLVGAFEEWAKFIGADAIVVGHFEDSIGESLSHVYKSIGYKPIERTYIKEL